MYGSQRKGVWTDLDEDVLLTVEPQTLAELLKDSFAPWRKAMSLGGAGWVKGLKRSYIGKTLVAEEIHGSSL